MTTALCLPCVVVAGAFLERTGVEKALTDTTLSWAFSCDFYSSFSRPGARGCYICLCVAQPSANNVGGVGFKYTALGAYHALLVKLPGEAEQDEWDYLGTAVTALASAVYTVEWFRAATRPAAGPLGGRRFARAAAAISRGGRAQAAADSRVRTGLSRPGGRGRLPSSSWTGGGSGPSCGCECCRLSLCDSLRLSTVRGAAIRAACEIVISEAEAA